MLTGIAHLKIRSIVIAQFVYTAGFMSPNGLDLLPF